MSVRSHQTEVSTMNDENCFTSPNSSISRSFKKSTVNENNNETDTRLMIKSSRNPIHKEINNESYKINTKFTTVQNEWLTRIRDMTIILHSLNNQTSVRSTSASNKSLKQRSSTKEDKKEAEITRNYWTEANDHKKSSNSNEILFINATATYDNRSKNAVSRSIALVNESTAVSTNTQTAMVYTDVNANNNFSTKFLITNDLTHNHYAPNMKMETSMSSKAKALSTFPHFKFEETTTSGSYLERNKKSVTNSTPFEANFYRSRSIGISRNDLKISSAFTPYDKAKVNLFSQSLLKSSEDGESRTIQKFTGENIVTKFKNLSIISHGGSQSEGLNLIEITTPAIETTQQSMDDDKNSLLDTLMDTPSARITSDRRTNADIPKRTENEDMNQTKMIKRSSSVTNTINSDNTTVSEPYHSTTVDSSMQKYHKYSDTQWMTRDYESGSWTSPNGKASKYKDNSMATVTSGTKNISTEDRLSSSKNVLSKKTTVNNNGTHAPFSTSIEGYSQTVTKNVTYSSNKTESLNSITLTKSTSIKSEHSSLKASSSNIDLTFKSASKTVWPKINDTKSSKRITNYEDQIRYTSENFNNNFAAVSTMDSKVQSMVDSKGQHFFITRNDTTQFVPTKITTKLGRTVLESNKNDFSEKETHRSTVFASDAYSSGWSTSDADTVNLITYVDTNSAFMHSTGTNSVLVHNLSKGTRSATTNKLDIFNTLETTLAPKLGENTSTSKENTTKRFTMDNRRPKASSSKSLHSYNYENSEESNVMQSLTTKELHQSSSFRQYVRTAAEEVSKHLIPLQTAIYSENTATATAGRTTVANIAEQRKSSTKTTERGGSKLASKKGMRTMDISRQISTRSLNTKSKYTTSTLVRTEGSSKKIVKQSSDKEAIESSSQSKNSTKMSQKKSTSFTLSTNESQQVSRKLTFYTMKKPRHSEEMPSKTITQELRTFSLEESKGTTETVVELSNFDTSTGNILIFESYLS